MLFQCMRCGGEVCSSSIQNVTFECSVEHDFKQELHVVVPIFLNQFIIHVTLQSQVIVLCRLFACCSAHPLCQSCMLCNPLSGWQQPTETYNVTFVATCNIRYRSIVV